MSVTCPAFASAPAWGRIGQLDPAVTWRDVAANREQWRGPLVLKGVARVDDVARALDAGADAVVLSNHGGRQLDLAVPPLDVLPAAASVADGRLQLLVDSGIRRGFDVAPPWLWARTGA